MGQDVTVFDEGWRTRASGSVLVDSWAREVMAAVDADGGRYLDTLRVWFERFPLSFDKQRRALKARLESFTTSDHLGAANELSWYEFMRRASVEASPIPSANAPRPDFKVTNPSEFLVEVSTLNISDADRRELQAGGGVDLNHLETLRRLLLKAAHEKETQLGYAARENRPCLLVLFDYTLWGGLATDFFRYLATALLGEGRAFAQVPVALSALVYAERKVLGGRIALSQRRSAIYYNPVARYRLAAGTFAALRQFKLVMSEVEPNSQKDWIWL